ncbi:hypothetical protein [Winogradskyella aurantiaca]|uniref:hypothetical protein n=1 Tax=Winogradskyella aurantiaca TaxID=2219558 RepID=UPI000E1C4FA5|nr:hypothetical protein [Winogradskyella aurantiaca]
MKNVILTLIIFIFSINVSSGQNPTVGQELIINNPNSTQYRYIDFPKLNTLVKRGKLANYKSVYGNEVIIDEVVTEDSGDVYVILKKKDGSKFFGYLTSVKANYSKALDSEELMGK